MINLPSMVCNGLQWSSIFFNGLQWTLMDFNLFNTFRLSVGKETPPEVRHQSINQLCIYACTCPCVIAHAPQAFGIVERAWVCAYAVRVAGVVLVSRPFASSRFEPAASNLRTNCPVQNAVRSTGTSASRKAAHAASRASRGRERGRVP